MEEIKTRDNFQLFSTFLKDNTQKLIIRNRLEAMLIFIGLFFSFCDP